MSTSRLRSAAPRRRMVLAVTTGVGTALACLIAAAPASASVIDRGHYTDSYADTFDACGMTVDVIGEVSGHFVEILRGDQPLSYIADHFVDRTTYTNVGTGRSWSTVITFTHLDLSIELIAGTTYRGTGQEAGTFSVYDSAGNLYYRDAGNRKFTAVFDISTDESLSFDVVHVGHFNDSDFCADLEALTTG
jgi:hypothetical protein